MTTNETQTVPQVGFVFTHPTLGNVKVIAVYDFGTMDVQNIYTGKCYRITGLQFLNAR